MGKTAQEEKEAASDPYATALVAQGVLQTPCMVLQLCCSLQDFCLEGANYIKIIQPSVSQGMKVTFPSNHSSSNF